MPDNNPLIATPHDLNDLAARLRGGEWIALDTEFIREKTYYPRLCLLQVATQDLTACVDPLALPDLSPLLDVLYDTNITKVLHAARQDLEIFHHLRGGVPAPVFDTQVAAPLLGHSEQMGYGALVFEFLGVTLNKDQTRADWSQRPLPQALLDYAANDVRYLARIYPRMRAALEEKGRLAWLAEDFAALADPALYETPPAEAWRRVRGHEQLRSEQISILQALAEWREETARAQDKPRGWLLRDDALLTLARLAPVTEEELARVRDLHERFAARHGATITALIRAAKERPPIPLPSFQRKERLTPQQEALADLLLAVVRLRAEEETLHPSVLASRKDIERLIGGDTETGLLHGWRRELIGDALLAMLRGEVNLRIRGGHIEIDHGGDR